MLLTHPGRTRRASDLRLPSGAALSSGRDSSRARSSARCAAASSSVPLGRLLVVLVCRRGGLLRVGRIDVITERHLALLVDHHLARPGVGHSLAPDDDAHTNATFPFSGRSEEHTSELQSLMRISNAVFCL